MTTVTHMGVDYVCAAAIKGDDYIHLLNEDGEMTVAFDGISDFKDFSITDGEWVTPTPEEDCYVAVVKDDQTMGKGGHKCSDLLTKSDTATSSEKLATARTVCTDLASASAVPFDGTENITPGVTGTLPIANGGTGGATPEKAREALGITPSNIGAADAEHTHAYSDLTGQPVFSWDESTGTLTITT